MKKYYYLGTDSSQVHVVKVSGLDDKNNEELQAETIQTVETPNPRNLPSGVYNGVSTEWIARHPKLNLLYVLTSYWNLLEACVTTYEISTEDGTLIKLGERSTEGYQATYATFSADQSVFVIAHHNDGKLVFFDCRDDNALETPLMVLTAPEVVPGTRREVKRNDGFPVLPSLHHIQYSPNGKYLLAVDPSQDCVFTYAIDERGLPKAKVPTSVFQGSSNYPIYGLFQRLITKYVLKCHQRARRVAIHPNGKYVFVLYESINRIQIYSISETGVIDSKNCWQDISTLDPNLVSSKYWPVGITLQLASELYISPDAKTLMVSNRGDRKVPLSRAESSIRAFGVQVDNSTANTQPQGGISLLPRGTLKEISGPVRHFFPLNQGSDDWIVAAVYQDRQCLQFYEKQEEETSGYKLRGETNVKANVFCIAH